VVIELSSSHKLMLFVTECWFCSYVTDSVVAVTVAMFLFIVPSRKPNYFCCWDRSGAACACVNSIM